MSDYGESVAAGGSGAGFIGVVRLSAGSDYQLIVGAGGNSQGAKNLGGSRDGTNATPSKLRKGSSDLITCGGGTHGHAEYKACTAGTGGTRSFASGLTYGVISLNKNGNNGTATKWTSSGGGSVGRTASVWSGHTYGSAASGSASCGGGKVDYSHHGYGQIRFLCKDPIIERWAAGSEQITIPFTGKYTVILVGGGSGGTYGWTQVVGDCKQGNQGGMISGTTIINAGTYTIVVGGAGGGAAGHGYQTSGAGGATSFNGNIARGGDAVTAFGDQRSGGTTTVVSSGLTGSNGAAGNNTGKYGSSGAGGAASYLSYANAGTSGYIKIAWTGQYS